jgi:hypothetical protein
MSWKNIEMKNVFGDGKVGTLHFLFKTEKLVFTEKAIRFFIA